MAQKILKYDMITIKSKLNGFTRTVGEPEFNVMIDKSDYEIISVKDGDDLPDKGWTAKELKAYMDSNSIAYKSSDNKAELLAKATA